MLRGRMCCRCSRLRYRCRLLIGVCGRALFLLLPLPPPNTQRVTSELTDVKRRLGEEQGRREQLDQISALLKQQLAAVTAEAEAGAATIAKLKVCGWDVYLNLNLNVL